MVLPRNRKGWGSTWSEAFRATTGQSLLPPLKADAPAVRPDEECRTAKVRIPAATQAGCPAPSEYLVQVLADVSRGWVTLEHALPGSVTQITGITPDSSFVVRLVAQNEYGAAPSSDSTALTPGPFSGCVSERTWSDEGEEPMDVDADGSAPEGGAANSWGRRASVAGGLVASLSLAGSVWAARRKRATASYGKLGKSEQHEPEDLEDFFNRAEAEDGPHNTVAARHAGGDSLALRSFHASSAEPSDDMTSDVEADLDLLAEVEVDDRRRRPAPADDPVEMMDAAGEAALLARVSELLGGGPLHAGAAGLNGSAHGEQARAGGSAMGIVVSDEPTEQACDPLVDDSGGARERFLHARQMWAEEADGRYEL